MPTLTAPDLLRLLQLASPALPVGAYSYSEGIETLVQQGRITSGDELAHWLTQELHYGAIRLEAVAMGHAQQAWQHHQGETLVYWNQWLSAVRETEELRQQSWQMGRSLLRLLGDLDATALESLPDPLATGPCNFAIAFGIAAALWQLPIEETTLIYLQSWATNLISAGVRLVPLGQTEGQRLLLRLTPTLAQAAQAIPSLETADLATCSWGPTLASMGHETLYSRLFRS